MTANELGLIVRTIAPLMKDQATRVATVSDVVQEAIVALRAELAEARERIEALRSDHRQVIAEEVHKVIAQLPTPVDGAPGCDGTPGKDGASVTVADMAPLVEELVTKAIGSLPTPKDGIGLTGALIDHEGQLILTLSDGTLKTLGQVKGKDGRDVNHGEVMTFLLGEIAKLPKPQDGKDGRDGKDGLGFDELELVEDETGRAVAKFVNGDRVKSIRLPGFVDRGVWRPEYAYVKGDGVTFGGSFFIAQTDQPSGKPEETPDWRLSVKRGRDGKNGDKGLDGKPGKDGKWST
jgi:hypothetical protein